MSLIPSSRVGKVEFFESKIAAWTANAAAIGLAPADVTAFAGKITAARSSFNNSETQRAVSRSATQTFYTKVSEMHGQGADFIATIRAYAQTKNDPNVYTLAQIPPPATPGVTPPPGKPEAFRVELLESGALVLGWKCRNPAGIGGTIYEVLRRFGGPGAAFTYIGSSGLRNFTDETIPSSAAAGGVTYRVTAVRSTARGEPAQFTVSFGVGGDGVAGAFIEDGDDEMKMAA